MFDIVAGKVVVDTKSLSVPPFAEYWNNSKDKDYATKVITYAVFMYKWNTPYKSYSPEDRKTKVISDIFGVSNIVFSDADTVFISRYQEFLATPLTRLLDGADEALELLTKTLLETGKEIKNGDYDLESRLKIAEKVSKLIKDIEANAKAVDSLKKRVQAEQMEGAKVKGGSEIGHYELPKK